VTGAARLEAMLRASPRVMRVLKAARDLALPDPLLFSGAIYQTAWNALTGRAPDHGINDYDLGYFDADTSWDAEDAVIRRVASALPPPLSGLVEVRNQARVHLWFEGRFGEPYAPLGSTGEALQRFVCPAFAAGARLEADGAITLVAPFGLDDLFALRLRPNPTRRVSPAGYARVVASARARWPELTADPPPPT
jgi:uncharacterized protein